VLALTLHIELFTQTHYRESIREDADLSELYRDVFFFHWKEECQQALMDELEWRRVDAGISDATRDMAVDELIELVGAVDTIVRAQAAADAEYFARTCGRRLRASETSMVQQTLLEAYRFQYILSGVRHPHFATTLASLTPPQPVPPTVVAASAAHSACLRWPCSPATATPLGLSATRSGCIFGSR
jgi:hypothetical protein